ncbi:HEAT repeat domain-containing protein [Methanococcus sp. CF]
MNINRIVSDLKNESWYTKLDAVNKLGNITYETQDDAEYVLKNLLIELESPKTVMQARILWAISNLVNQHPKLTYKTIPHLLMLSTHGNNAVKEISNELLNTPLLQYATTVYSTLLSKNMHSNHHHEKLRAIVNIWKMAPIDPELIDSLLPELIESLVNKNNLKIGIFSWILLESDDDETIEEIVDTINKVYLHIEPNITYPQSHIIKLINSPDRVMKLVGIQLIEENPENVNNEIMEDLLKLFTSPNTDRFVKAKMFYTIGLLSKTKPYLRNILINEANKSIHGKQDWLSTFSALVGFYIIGEKLTNLEFLNHPNPLIRAVAIQLMDSRSSEQILSCFNSRYVTTYLSIIDRLMMSDISDDVNLKFLNELSNPENYPYLSENIDENSIALLQDNIDEIVRSWDPKPWLYKITLLNDVGNLVKNNPGQLDSFIELIIKSMDDKYWIVRSQGLWIIRTMLYQGNDPFQILKAFDEHLKPLININDPSAFARLNYVLFLRNLLKSLRNTEGHDEEFSKIAGYLIYIALNDSTKIVSDISKQVLKYDFDITIDRKDITIDTFEKYLKSTPYSSTGILKYLLKQNLSNEKVVLKLIDLCREYQTYGCDIACILYKLDIDMTSKEIFEKLNEYMADTTEKCQNSAELLVKMHLKENNWKVKLSGISMLEKMVLINPAFIENFLIELISSALFDRTFNVRERAGKLLEKINYKGPNIDMETSINYLYKTNNELIDIIKNEESEINEAFYVLSIRDKGIENIENLMTIVSKFKNDEFWYRRAYAYKILENLLTHPKSDYYQYEIISWCLEGNEDSNPVVSKLSRNILDKLGRTVQPSSNMPVQDRIRRIENLLESDDWTVKVEALHSIKDFIDEGHYGYLDVVTEKLDDPHWKVKNAALGILADIDPELIKPAIPKIISLLNDGDESVILKTLLTLKKFGQKDPKIIENIMPKLEKLDNYGTWSIKEEIMKLKLIYYNKLRQKH